MSNKRKIDRSFMERRRIIKLLDLVKRDDLSSIHIEKIGKILFRFGDRAINPLIRKLWQERDASIIFRYNSILLFFNPALWVDQLIDMAIKRDDLDEQAKFAILDLLDEAGVDTTAPPFSALAGYGAESLEGFISESLAAGEGGMIRLLDAILDTPNEERSFMLDSISVVGTAEASAILEILAAIDNPEMAEAAVSALGKQRSGYALAALKRLKKKDLQNEIKQAVDKSIKRLAFLNIRNSATAAAKIDDSSFEFYDILLSPPDYYGNQALWLSWAIADGISAMIILLTDTDGVASCGSYTAKNEQEYLKLLEDVADGFILATAEIEYTISILLNAVYKTSEQGRFLPADYYIMTRNLPDFLLRGKAFTPVTTLESICNHIEGAIADYDLSLCETLLDDPCLENWVISERTVYDAAEKILALESGKKGKKELSAILDAEINLLAEKIIREDKTKISTRILSVLDYMLYLGETEAISVSKYAFTAFSIENEVVPLNRHPFIRRLCRESIDLAKQSLKQGFDPRIEEDYYE